jgi:ribonuclease VapC
VIVDSSALIAILFSEPEGHDFQNKIAQASRPMMSTANFLESAIVADRAQDKGYGRVLDLLVDALGIEMMPVTMEQARVAREAFQTYGKGAHPAGLNFGDCFAYALAKTQGVRLLFKGNDFSRTDVSPA